MCVCVCACLSRFLPCFFFFFFFSLSLSLSLCPCFCSRSLWLSFFLLMFLPCFLARQARALALRVPSCRPPGLDEQKQGVPPSLLWACQGSPDSDRTLRSESGPFASGGLIVSGHFLLGCGRSWELNLHCKCPPQINWVAIKKLN